MKNYSGKGHGQPGSGWKTYSFYKDNNKITPRVKCPHCGDETAVLVWNLRSERVGIYCGFYECGLTRIANKTLFDLTVEYEN